MKFKYSVCILGLSAVLAGCGGPPDVSPANCGGKGLESSLGYFTNETERQAFLDECEALAASQN